MNVVIISFFFFTWCFVTVQVFSCQQLVWVFLSNCQYFNQFLYYFSSNLPRYCSMLKWEWCFTEWGCPTQTDEHLTPNFMPRWLPFSKYAPHMTSYDWFFSPERYWKSIHVDTSQSFLTKPGFRKSFSGNRPVPEFLQIHPLSLQFGQSHMGQCWLPLLEV